MRNKIRKQLSLVEPSNQKHHHAKELHAIRVLVSEKPEVLDLVHKDLIRSLIDPDAGRKGLMTAEQVFMALLIKQMNGFSYEVLSFHLEDSKTYRCFCGFGICDYNPSHLCGTGRN